MTILANRAKMSVSSGGSGVITLGSAITSFQSFAAAGITDGQSISYVVDDPPNWEVGVGTYTASGTTLTRNTILASNNGGAAINATTFAVCYISPNAADMQSGTAANNLSRLDSNGLVPAATLPTPTSTLLGGVTLDSQGNNYFRNKIANGNFLSIDTHGASPWTIGATASAYTFNRWIAVGSGANTSSFTVNRNYTAGVGTSATITGAAGLAGTVALSQRIESLHCLDLIGAPTTIQAVLSSTSTATSTITWQLSYAASPDVWTSQTLLASGTWTVNSTPTIYRATVAAGTMVSNVGNGLVLSIRVTGMTNGALTVTNVQLERGNIATPFQYPVYPVEQYRCYRYATPTMASSFYGQSLGNPSTFYMQASGWAAPFQAGAVVTTNVTSSSNCSLTAASALTNGGVQFAITSTGALGTNWSLGVSWSINTEL
jgi:hypothetical protein